VTVIKRVNAVFIDAELAETPGAAASLDHLVAAGHEIVVLEPDSSAIGDCAAGASGWLLTSSVEACGRRPRGITSVLVGPRRPAGRGPRARCDLEARDLASAVLEVLSREAMP
jgi:hypothetical protein